MAQLKLAATGGAGWIWWRAGFGLGISGVDEILRCAQNDGVGWCAAEVWRCAWLRRRCGQGAAKIRIGAGDGCANGAEGARDSRDLEERGGARILLSEL